MNYSNNKGDTVSRTDRALAREVYRAYLDELSAITSYTYYRILTEQDLPAAATLCSGISMDEMDHFLHLGQLLQKWGVSPAVDTHLREKPIALLADRDSHVPVVVRRILSENARNERKAAANYRSLANATGDSAARSLFLELAHDEESHADAQEALARRLAQS